MPGSADVAISDLLASEGFPTPEAQAAARTVLEAVGLTRAGKTRIAASKLSAVQATLAGHLDRACADCLAQGACVSVERQMVEVPSESCPLCRGSVNRRAMSDVVRRCAQARITNILVVGGTPVLHETLEKLSRELHANIRWRFVEATERVRTKDEAGAHLRWAHLAVVWAPSPLPHKVSNLYTEHPEARRKRPIPCHQRGIAALCVTIGASV